MCCSVTQVNELKQKCEENEKRVTLLQNERTELIAKVNDKLVIEKIIERIY